MLDIIDKKILFELQNDGKQTIKDLSNKLNLTSTPIYERIKRLEQEGYITGYKAQINRQKVGLKLLVFCNVSLKEHQSTYLSKFEEDIQQFNEVLACFHLGGMYDYLLKVCVEDIETYQDFISNKLANIDNIANVQSSFVMKEIKSSDAYHFS